MKLVQMVAVLAVASALAPAIFAQTADPHHPSQATTPAPAQPPQPSYAQPGMGCMSMMNMMGGMPMINMMGMMAPDMTSMATIDRVEGRIAFLRAELEITEAQTNAWTAFADPCA
jgi:predicted lipid-binding transport protein (Tim44 family)